MSDSDINKTERQTRMYVNNKETTHTLVIRISNATWYRSKIVQLIRDIMHYRQLTETIELEDSSIKPVTLTWTMNNMDVVNTNIVDSCFYCLKQSFNDNAIQLHTEQMLTNIVQKIKREHPEYGEEWVLSFVLSTIITNNIIV